ncbi:MAG: conserved hypothetical protein containing N-terminal of heat shock protein DnaJ [Rhodospirillaceae bacterium]|nr:MAG: conserved hypothetical protein containing N-terminal of heat shock protein DnaJ [Rhodospirillaceae bacterium]
MRPTVETAFLHMVFEQRSRHLSGWVLSGPLARRWLGNLSLSKLMVLYRLCAADQNSREVLETWGLTPGRTWQLACLRFSGTRRGVLWRKRQQGRASSGRAGMTRTEALRVLDLDADATPDQILEVYCRLMASFHPDHGGSSYLAAQINHAKDVLLDS